MAWTGQWIGPAYDPRVDIGIFAFRRRVTLDRVPEKLLVHVSADNRYRLLVNGTPIAFGPQRGDREHWYYDTIDLAPHLKAGENTILAMVWNFGFFGPMAQMSLRTGFLLDDPDHGLSTPTHWEVTKVDGWEFEMIAKNIRNFYIDIGPGELVDGQKVPNWTTLADDNTQKWHTPNNVRGASPRGSIYEPMWGLIPRTIPAMRYDATSIVPTVRHGFTGDPNPTGAEQPLSTFYSIEPGVPLLLDFKELLCAYPRLSISGPAGTEITVTYAEAMWTHDGQKGHRNDVTGKEIRGYQDKIVLGTSPLVFEPLWWRTFRFLQIDVAHATSAVTLQSMQAMETGYPYTVESSFEADDDHVAPIWDVALRTAHRCAGETYFDCPYYEQCQYAGDTRVQVLIHYYMTRDRALERNAVSQFRWSLIDNGLTQSRYPNRVTQIIPPFSLWWILMQRDAMLYDRVPVLTDSERIANERVLATYGQIVEGTVEPFWQFGDWVKTWKDGAPPGGARSTMHRLTLLLAEIAALDVAHQFQATEMVKQKRELIRSFQADYTNRNGLIAHRLDAAWHPSEHAEALYRIAARWLGVSVPAWPTQQIEAAGADRCTYYFQFYKHAAMEPADYLSELGSWKEMIEDGLTTFAENPPPVRSDCHAWSAHPALGFFQYIAGVTSDSVGWKHALIEPRPGPLKRFAAKIAHPDGDITVHYEDGKLKIDTPVPATLIWKGKKKEIAPGLFGL